MRILLLGDFSSLHRYLKEGLQHLGYDVTLVSNGDGWKKIGGKDFPLYEKEVKCESKFLRLLLSYREAKKIINKLNSYDVIQFINPRIYHSFFNKLLVDKIMKKGKKLALVCCGNDLALNKAYENGCFDYYMMDWDKNMTDEYNPYKLRGFVYRNTEKSIVKKMDYIIPMAYEYSIGYRECMNKFEVVPMPINVSNILYKENVIREKIVIFHGISREEAKGTPFIKTALNKIQNKYKDQIEIIVDGHLPFDQYIKIMDKANIVIDQCCSYTYGINAGIAMAQGKVVLSGAREETLGALGVENCPIFGIRPDSNQIYETLDYILMHREQIVKWGELSRKYVEDVHDCKKVAEKFLGIWSA